MTQVRRMFKGSIVSFIALIVSGVLAYAFSFIAARILGANGLGQLEVGLSALSFATLVALAGIPAACWHFVPRYLRSPGRLKGFLITILLVLLSASLVGMIVLAAIAVTKSGPLDSILRAMAFALPFTLLSMALLNVCIGSFRFIHKLSFELADGMTRVLALLVAAAFGAVAAGVAWAIAFAAAVLFAVMLFVMLRSLAGKLRGAAVLNTSQVWRFLWPLMFSGVVTAGVTNIAVLFLAAFHPSAAVGIFALVYRIGTVVTLGLMAITVSFPPIASMLLANRDTRTLGELYTQATMASSILAFAIGGVFLFCARDILVLFGDAFYTGATALIIITVCQMFNALAGPCGLILSMAGRTRLILANNIMNLCALAVMCVLLIPQYGALGAAIAAGTSLIFINVLRVVEVKMITGLLPWDVGMLRLIAIGMLSSAVFILPLHWIAQSMLFVCGVVAGSIAFCVDKELVVAARRFFASD